MDPSDFAELANQLEALSRTVGGVGIALLAALVLAWAYLRRTIDLVAEEASQKSLKRFQAGLDKDFHTFQVAHQRQVDAIHTVFQRFQALVSSLAHLEKAEPFTRRLKPRDELGQVVAARHGFKQAYLENRILFSRGLCDDIDKLIPKVDEFIQTYESGLLDLDEETIRRNAELNNGMYIAGLWSIGSLEGIREEIGSIANSIEREFRVVYQTDGET